MVNLQPAQERSVRCSPLMAAALLKAAKAARKKMERPCILDVQRGRKRMEDSIVS